VYTQQPTLLEHGAEVGVRYRRVQAQGVEEHEFDFFFQAEDGIRDLIVTGVQTCALPICASPNRAWATVAISWTKMGSGTVIWCRSEERRVGKECRARRWPDAEINKQPELVESVERRRTYMCESVDQNQSLHVLAPLGALS